MRVYKSALGIRMYVRQEKTWQQHELPISNDREMITLGRAGKVVILGGNAVENTNGYQLREEGETKVQNQDIRFSVSTLHQVPINRVNRRYLLTAHNNEKS